MPSPVISRTPRRQTATCSLTLEEESCLLSAASLRVRKVFEHVRAVCLETGDTDYLPKQRELSQRAHYWQLQYMRSKALSAEDYRLLAHCPRILGPEVFGDVEEVDGGWRWTFAPAGIAIHGTPTYTTTNG